MALPSAGSGLLGGGLAGGALNTSSVTAISRGGPNDTTGTFGGSYGSTAVTFSITTRDGKARIVHGGLTPDVSVPPDATNTTAGSCCVVDSVEASVITIFPAFRDSISTEVLV